MSSKKNEALKALIDFVNSFYKRELRSPSFREIEAELGFSRQSALRYVQELDSEGILRYDGRTIVTEYIDKLTSKDTESLPVVGSIPCGVPDSREELHEDYLSIPKEWLGIGTHYILKAKGKSMIGAGIDDGDLVIIRQTGQAEYGQIVAVLDEMGGSTLKRLVFDKRKKRPVLHPENPEMEDICPEEIFIHGVAIKVIKNLN